MATAPAGLLALSPTVREKVLLYLPSEGETSSSCGSFARRLQPSPYAPRATSIPRAAYAAPLLRPAPPEVLPIPAAAVWALALGWSSLPLALAGPAGILAGWGAFYFRARFRALESFVPGHRGAGLVASVAWYAGAGIALGAVATIVLVLVASVTTVPAK